MDHFDAAICGETGGPFAAFGRCAEIADEADPVLFTEEGEVVGGAAGEIAGAVEKSLPHGAAADVAKVGDSFEGWPGV